MSTFKLFIFLGFFAGLGIHMAHAGGDSTFFSFENNLQMNTLDNTRFKQIKISFPGRLQLIQDLNLDGIKELVFGEHFPVKLPKSYNYLSGHSFTEFKIISFGETPDEIFKITEEGVSVPGKGKIIDGSPKMAWLVQISIPQWWNGIILTPLSFDGAILSEPIHLKWNKVLKTYDLMLTP